MPATPGTAPARLVLGPDLRVRELRLDGDEVARGARLPTGLRGKLAAAPVTIRLAGLGTPVTISTSPPAAVPPTGPATAVLLSGTSAPLEEREASATITTEIPGWLLPAVAAGVAVLGGLALAATRRRR